MKKCPFCAEEIQDDAIVCRHCGRDLLKRDRVDGLKKTARSIGRKIAIAALLFVILMIVLATVDAVKRNGAPEKRRLDAGVKVGPLSLSVTNRDHQDWRNVRVEVNDKYKCPPFSLDEGASENVSLISCTMSDGTRFSPASSAAVSIYVTASLQSDGGELSNLFDAGH